MRAKFLIIFPITAEFCVSIGLEVYKVIRNITGNHWLSSAFSIEPNRSNFTVPTLETLG